jgi:5-carboxymethyl-2-hydroxymuconate isomerase
MAHAVVEYTDNLGPEACIPELLEKLGKKFGDSGGVFPVGGIRVRAICLTEYFVADGQGDDAFVNVTVLMGAGRTAEFKAKFFGEMFEIVKDHFAWLFERRGLALTLYVNEADEAGSFKHNNLHARLKARS